jgi:RpiR family carbohydrate utilization transcriptional regulator
VPELNASCAIAKEYGVRLVAITALGSPLAAMADVLLPLKSLETDFIFKPSSSRYAMMMALDVLMTELALLQKDRSQELLRRLKFTLDTHRGGGNREPLGD